MRIETLNPRQTEDVGASLAPRLRPGDAVVVSGDLGTGKTTLVRGACRALGVEGPVTSPTFSIGQLYEGRRPDGSPLEVAHLDLYRLASLSGTDEGLLADYLTAERIAFVEWPDAGAAELGDRVAVRVAIEHLGGDRRVVRVE
ncbi:MAG TPA: tRNA (adenosine(37)-N6)-threonylcarbamoyltransferase complex ATPase subunit type 1 TsaE [Thermoleophilaceae bacterium]